MILTRPDTSSDKEDQLEPEDLHIHLDRQSRKIDGSDDVNDLQNLLMHKTAMTKRIHGDNIDLWEMIDTSKARKVDKTSACPGDNTSLNASDLGDQLN